MALQEMAPDGAPKTPIARSMAFGGVKIYPTFPVKRKSDGVICVVSEEGFDPKLYVRLKEGEAEKVPPKGAKADGEGGFVPVANSGYSRGELAAMSIEAIHALPEWERVPNKSTLKTKDEIILAVIAARTIPS